MIYGGGQELRRRAGTENLAGISGFAAVVASRLDHVKAFRDALEAQLEGATIFGQGAERLPNTTCFAMPGMIAETLVMAFDLAASRSPPARRVHRANARSHVLGAMGFAPEVSGATIRVSLGWTTAAEDIEHFIATWQRLLARHRARVAA